MGRCRDQWSLEIRRKRGHSTRLREGCAAGCLVVTYVTCRGYLVDAQGVRRLQARVERHGRVDHARQRRLLQSVAHPRPVTRCQHSKEQTLRLHDRKHAACGANTHPTGYHRMLHVRRYRPSVESLQLRLRFDLRRVSIWPSMIPNANMSIFRASTRLSERERTSGAKYCGVPPLSPPTLPRASALPFERLLARPRSPIC